jgi:hypothetical protein
VIGSTKGGSEVSTSVDERGIARQERSRASLPRVPTAFRCNRGDICVFSAHHAGWRMPRRESQHKGREEKPQLQAGWVRQACFATREMLIATPERIFGTKAAAWAGRLGNTHLPGDLIKKILSPPHHPRHLLAPSTA